MYNPSRRQPALRHACRNTLSSAGTFTKLSSSVCIQQISHEIKLIH